MTMSKSRRLKPLFSQVANTNQTRQLDAQFLQSRVRSTIIGEENSNGCEVLPAFSGTGYRPRHSDVTLIEITENIDTVIERVQRQCSCFQVRTILEGGSLGTTYHAVDVRELGELGKKGCLGFSIAH